MVEQFMGLGTTVVPKGNQVIGGIKQASRYAKNSEKRLYCDLRVDVFIQKRITSPNPDFTGTSSNHLTNEDITYSTFLNLKVREHLDSGTFATRVNIYNITSYEALRNGLNWISTNHITSTRCVAETGRIYISDRYPDAPTFEDAVSSYLDDTAAFFWDALNTYNDYAKYREIPNRISNIQRDTNSFLVDISNPNLYGSSLAENLKIIIPAGVIFKKSITSSMTKNIPHMNDDPFNPTIALITGDVSIVGDYGNYSDSEFIAMSEIEIDLVLFVINYTEMAGGWGINSFYQNINAPEFIISSGESPAFNIPPAGTIDDGGVIDPDDIFKSDPNRNWIEKAQIPMVLDNPPVYLRDDEIISYANSHANKQNQFVVLGETVKVCSKDNNGIFSVRELSATFDINKIAEELIPMVKEAILEDMKIVISADSKDDIVANLVFDANENKYIMDYDTSLLDGSDYDISVTLGD